MKTQNCRDITPQSPPCRRRPRFRLRGRTKKNRMIRGKLRIRSMPGAFLVLGVVVVAVGAALAVAGYWPYRFSRSSIPEDAEQESISDPQPAGWSLNTKGLLSTSGLLHGDRMKLLGPVIMGVGLFILICANTVLYENRDKETQMLLAQMRNVICSVSAAVPTAGLGELAAANSMTKHYQWVSSLPAAHLNILCLQDLAYSEPLLQTAYTRDQEASVGGIHQQAALKTEVLHHQESPPLPSLPSSHFNLQKPCQEDSVSQTGAELSSKDGLSLNTAPLPKLNFCLVSASSMSNLRLGDGDLPVAQQRRCHSMSYRTKPDIAKCRMHFKKELLPFERQNQAKGLQIKEAETCSQVCVRIPVEAAEEDQTHGSWPRLELVGGRRYLKLENKEDSVDKLLDQLEQQCSHWDRSFGSGPFQ
ncbi:PREDICTED: transmembrane protein 200A-like [Cyprinodon variegatus]|uniref:Transmembrane protein 200B n=1 Tax=Cyprinodon variegatus TaxID=28743 RepID=A0A3Q2EBT9_CYPVA|nr:PREDICTED: transmembrane protein 200A-like [Cyprinodon variegatus]